MGKIRKTASTRHEASLSPFLSDFIKTAITTPIHLLPKHLSSFPALWPFPRGDLYHWIGLLNRFDDVLNVFLDHYQLKDGPQTCELGIHVLQLFHDAPMRYDRSTPEQIQEQGFSKHGDKELIQSILSFTALLLDNCGNRSLYASSENIDKLLNTTELPLIKSVLSLGLRLAKRYSASRVRYSGQNIALLLHNHYRFDLDHLHRLASPFNTSLATVSDDPFNSHPSDKTPGQAREEAHRELEAESQVSGVDLAGILRTSTNEAGLVDRFGDVQMSIYKKRDGQTGDDYAMSHEDPESPSSSRPNGASRRQVRRARSGLENDAMATPARSNVQVEPDSISVKPVNSAESIHINKTMLQSRPVHDILKEYKDKVPMASMQELLCRLRVAAAMVGNAQSREDIISIRLLALANVAYIDSDTQYQQKIGLQDAEQPRRHQLATQLATLVQPPEASGLTLPLTMQTYTLWALEAIAKQKSYGTEIYNALNANVNHGILFFIVRQAVSQISRESAVTDLVEEQWRDALFNLLSTLPATAPRAGDSMMSAGLLDILVEVLNLRTMKAERTHNRVLSFLDTFVYSVREALQSLANAKGLDAIAELSADTVKSAFERVDKGEGMPIEYKTKLTDYAIPFYQQLTLRWLSKFLNHTMHPNSGNMNRQLRNLIESPQVLGSLRRIIDNSGVFGANVWSGAVNILSNYIHNEPTSYSVIAEARLNEAFLDAVTAHRSPGNTDMKVLPVAEAILAIPNAFGALCLNENGAKLLSDSGALEAFFDTFISPDHIKGIGLEAETAESLGTAFDELVRHHPTLKDSIVKSVIRMVSKVASLCHERAVKGVGTKLYKAGPDGKLYVVGGRAALSGSPAPTDITSSHQEANGDTDMTVPGQKGNSEEQNLKEACVDEIIDREDANDSPSVISFVAVVGRFLTGFFSNKSTCQSFIEHGGLYPLIDMCTSPSLPFGYESKLAYGNELVTTLQSCIEEKPHLALPAILNRLDGALDELEPLINYTSPTSFLSAFTTPKPTSDDSPNPHLTDGTKYVKALVVVNTLNGVLQATFTGQIRNQRSQAHVFYQVNFADLYVRIVDKLGRLRDSCLWESILLKQLMPASWDTFTHPYRDTPGHPEYRASSDPALSDPVQASSATSSGEPSTDGTSVNPEAPNPDVQPTEEELERSNAQFRNTTTLRYLLFMVPHKISGLFIFLARILLIRRVGDSYFKSNAVKVANQLAKSHIEQFQSARVKASADMKSKVMFWKMAFRSVKQLISDEHDNRPQTQINTLTLQSFAYSNGFHVLEETLDLFLDQLKTASLDSDKPDDDEDSDMTFKQHLEHGIDDLLHLYRDVATGRNIVDAPQTQTLASRNSDRGKPDYFSGPQFLVELRLAAIKPAIKIWTSGIVDYAETRVVKQLIDTLRVELEGDQEGTAYTRNDKIPQRTRPAIRKWKLKSIANLESLKVDFPEDLAIEALFRCHENPGPAREYCRNQVDDARSQRNPIPDGDMVDIEPPARAAATASENAQDESSEMNDVAAEPAELTRPVFRDIADSDDPLSFMSAIPGMPPGLLESLQREVPLVEAPPAVTSSEDVKNPGEPIQTPTIDDLNEQREILRQDLVDRCLDVINVHGSLSFDLAELLTACVATPKVSNPTLRSEIGSTLLLSLMSLQIDDELSTEDFRSQAKKIASYAHLLALVLQDKAFYDTLHDELVDNFDALTSFIRVYPEEKTRDMPSWFGQILLIQEKLLSSNLEPKPEVFDRPNASDAIKDYPALGLYDPAFQYVDASSKESLFQALLDIMPTIAKSESLALSVSRVLVNLTRDRSLALRLGEKQNLDRFFKMIKQLCSFRNEQLQSSVMLVLRHIVEDDDMVRQIMKSEILAIFDGRTKQIEATAYLRNASHLVLRNPEVFVSVSNEVLQLSKYDTPHTQHFLTIKPVPVVTTDEAAISKDEETGASAQSTKSSETPSKPLLERVKTSDLKMPVVDNPGGVIHHLISELLAYKDVDDPKPTSKVQQTNADIEMADGGVTSDPASSEQNGQHEATSKDAEQEFKNEENSIYIYKCFLLQSLTELFSSYNRAKHEFINYKRSKIDTQATTPSKPRSFVLNYLLSGLIPCGFLNHPSNVREKKILSISQWASSVVTALCTKTGELGYIKPPSDHSQYQEEPDLLFVQRFVLEHALRAFKEAQANTEPLEHKYSRLLGLADLFIRLLSPKTDHRTNHSPTAMEMQIASQRTLAKIMFEKNFIASLTASVAEIDLNFPEAKRVVKYILRPLKTLTQTAVDLSMHSDVPLKPGEEEDDDISTASSSESELDHMREETPDLFRNSALGILDPRRDEDDDDESSHDEDDEEDIYEEEYADDMEYEEEDRDPDEVISDDDEDIEGMGPMEGLPGDDPMNLEVDLMDPDDIDEEASDMDDEDMDDDEDDEDEDGDEMDLEEIDEDGIIGEMGADDEDWGTEDEGEGSDGMAYEEDIIQPYDPDLNAGLAGSEIPEIMEVIDTGRQQTLLRRLGEARALISGLGDGEPDDFLEDGDIDEEDEEEGEDPEDYDGEDIIYEPGADDDEDGDLMGGWEYDGPHPGQHHHHHRHTHIHGHPGRMHPWGGMFGITVGPGDRGAPPYRGAIRGGSQRRPDDGTNPLLQRAGTTGSNGERHSHMDPLSDMQISYMPTGGARNDPNAPVSFISNLLTMMNHAPMSGGMRFGISIDGQTATGPEGMDALFRAIGGSRAPGLPHHHSHRSSRSDPISAVTFVPGITTTRWLEESRLLFGITGPDRAARIVDAILSQLIPQTRRLQQAAEEARKKEEEARQAEARRQEEEQAKIAAEKAREEEERKAKEAAEAAESAAQAGSADADPTAGTDAATAEEMEGVESTQDQPGQTDQAATERIIVRVRGRNVDITGLGIDMAYMEELPEEWREEVILQQIAQARAAAPVAAEPSEQPSGLPTDFLEALPPEIRQEFEEHEAHERRRREREEARRSAQAAGQAVLPEEMDPASFFATLDPQLRQDLLMNADDETLATLPPDLVAEAHALGAGRQIRRFNERARRPGQAIEGNTEEVVRKVRPVMQILDKAGVATLMRLMFIPQNHGVKNSLNGILKDICANKQNRAEVVSLLLLILQDGSSDMNAVEKSFTQLSLRAKQPSNALKTPQGKTTGVESFRGSSEVSPLVVVTQCLSALSHLVHANKGVADFFLREHEMGANLKVRMSRKGKNKETKANKFPINALLNMLDHKLVVDSSPAMEQLASLLATITHPLLTLQKREKEKADAEKKASENAATETGQSSTTHEPQAMPEGESASVETSEGSIAAVQQATAEDQPADAEAAGDEEPEESSDKKKSRMIEAPPEIPEHNLRLVVSIIAARECTSKTFKDTLSLMTHLSAISKARSVFGTELRSRAQDLGESILKDLQDLLDQIGKSKDGSEVQGLALSRFSPASSDQGKLLRVITTLDYLFDPKRSDLSVDSRGQSADGAENQTREEILTSLYENDVFGPLWIKLSDTLTAVGKQGNLLSIATILLPLIEVLMVVCKNTTLKDAPISSSLKEVTLSSPPPESRIESIFFKFTEEHRKILNDLVRHNPKLMSGSFSLLVKNSKVLEFDNKRNYFHRQLHTRRSETRPHSSLQLSVRRADVFLDSYKALYYKKPDEIKFGKLNIRFNGEEGVDAGGVTREWFQVLAKQMFNPNYALFNPITADRTTFHPNPLSGINGEHLAFFKFVGRIIGKAMYESRVLDCHFSRAVYKRILGKNVTLKDMESLDQEFHKSMEWIMHNDITDIIIDTFSIEEEVFGETKITDLIENGRNIPVTQENKQEYVQRMVDYKMIGSVKEQLEHFLIGFHDIVPPELISIFNEQELELLISGLPDIDVDDWKNNTDYSNYQASSPQIQWFWRAVRSFDKEERAKLLQFITGTSRVPLNGFKELEGMNGFTRFNIHRDYQDKSRLPSSHTCFNQLDLPEYESYEQLRKALFTAMTQGSEYFGFA